MATGKLVNDAEKKLRAWLTRRSPGERLPFGRTLAEQIDVGYYALNRALGRLHVEGVLERDGNKLFMSARTQAAERLVCHLVIARGSEHLASYRRLARELDVELVVRGWEAAEEVEAILEDLDTADTSAVICDPPADFGNAGWINAARRLTRRGIPLVAMGWATDELSSVSVNFARGVDLAISHLASLGHEELALVTAPAVGARGVEMLDSWKTHCARRGWPASADRIHLQAGSLSNPDEIEALVKRLAGPWRGVTGLVLRPTYDCAIQALLDELARKGRRVPASLSLVVLDNVRSLHATNPRVTTASIDRALWQEIAFDLVRREVRKRAQPGMPAPSVVQVMPRLAVRDSTTTTAGSRKNTPASAVTRLKTEEPRKTSPMTTAMQEKAMKTPYALAARASLSEQSRFSPIDLGPHVNRPLNFRRGWLGDRPLRGFRPGVHEVHGVPFQILGGSRRADGGAIVFRSTVNAKGQSHALPERLVIPIGARADAIYFLHGCGYAKPMQRFASYRFHSKTGKIDDVPLIGLGLGSFAREGGAALTPPDAGNANIQDWWSDFPHADFPHARMVPLPDISGSSRVRRYQYLYTLEWINPQPERLIRHLEIRADPLVATTLGVLAITVVKPRKR